MGGGGGGGKRCLGRPPVLSPVSLSMVETVVKCIPIQPSWFSGVWFGFGHRNAANQMIRFIIVWWFNLLGKNCPYRQRAYMRLVCKKRFLLWEGRALIAAGLTTSPLVNFAAILTLNRSSGIACTLNDQCKHITRKKRYQHLVPEIPMIPKIPVNRNWLSRYCFNFPATFQIIQLIAYYSWKQNHIRINSQQSFV